MGNPFYSSRRWLGARDRYRARNPLCELCKAKGKVSPMAYVDHIHEIEDGGAKMDVRNFMALCASCHGWKTAEMERRRQRGDVLTFVKELGKMRAK